MSAKRREGEKGQTATLFALMIFVILGFASLTIDIGFAFVERERTRAAAGAAALAAATSVARGDYGSATGSATSYAQANDVNNITISYLPSGPSSDTTSVRIAATVSWQPFFATVFGMNVITATATSQADILHPNQLSGSVYPIAVEDETVEEAIEECEEEGECEEVDIMEGTNPGNFGWLRWPGDPTGNPSLIQELTSPGTAPTLTVGGWVPGNTGVSNSSGVRNALDWWVSTGTPMTIIVWDRTQGSGSNTQYRIAGFASFVLTRYDLPDKRIWGIFQQRVIPEAQTGGPNFGVATLKLSQ